MYEFTFQELIQHYKLHKKRFFLNTFLAFVIGLIVSFSIPKVYTSTVRLVSETSKENGSLGGSMSSLASLAGINLGNSADAIGPSLYPDVVASNKFLIALLYTPVTTSQGKHYRTFMTYAQTEERLPWWSAAIKGTIQGGKSLFGKKGNGEISDAQQFNPTRLTPEQEALVKGMKGAVECSVNDDSGVIALKAYSQDPVVAKTLVEAAQRYLQEFITEYRTSKVRNNLNYYSSLEKQLHKKYLAAQKRYASYADSHMSPSLVSYSSKIADLENEMQAAYTAYSQMKQQVVVAEGKVQERTPVFTIVEDAYVPNRATSPRKALFLISFLLIGFFGTAIWFYLRLLFSSPTPSSAEEQEELEDFQ